MSLGARARACPNPFKHPCAQNHLISLSTRALAQRYELGHAAPWLCPCHCFMFWVLYVPIADPIQRDPTRPDPTRPDPTRPDTTRPDPTKSHAQAANSRSVRTYLDPASTRPRTQRTQKRNKERHRRNETKRERTSTRAHTHHTHACAHAPAHAIFPKLCAVWASTLNPCSPPA